VPLDELADAPGQGLVIAALSLVGAIAVYVAFIGLPRALSH
jgi:hypothetical protein